MYVALVAIGYVTLAAVYAAWVRLRTERRLIDVQEVARTLEDVLFVPLPPVLGPVRIGASYVSASRATRVGGDLYKAVPSPYGVRLVIADVQGKGLGTIRCAAVVLAAFREAGPEYENLTEVGRRIESALKRSTDGQRFVTGILAQISPDGQLLAFNQGHPAPLLRTADGDIRFIEPDEPVPPFGLTGLAGSGDVLDSVTRLAPVVVLDTQSVHVAAGVPAVTSGHNPAKRALGREPSPAVPVLGPVIAVVVLAANTHDNAGWVTCSWTRSHSTSAELSAQPWSTISRTRSLSGTALQTGPLRVQETWTVVRR